MASIQAEHLAWYLVFRIFQLHDKDKLEPWRIGLEKLEAFMLMLVSMSRQVQMGFDK